MSTILITDDDSAYRAGIIELLQFEGYELLEAEDGVVAMHLIRDHQPDLILCDVDMPVMSGIEVLRTVKSNPTTRDIPFVTITGRTDTPTITTIQELGASAYIRKPMNIEELLNLIRTLISSDQ